MSSGGPGTDGTDPMAPAVPAGPMATGPAVKRRPVLGLVAGLLLGLGISVLLITYAQAPLGKWTPAVVLGALIVLGVLWGLFAPARKSKSGPKAPRPAA